MPDQLSLLKVDDQPVDRLVLQFIGEIELNPRDPGDRKLWDDLKLGKIRAFHVSGPIRGKGTKQKPATEHKPDVVTQRAVLAVDSLLGVGEES